MSTDNQQQQQQAKSNDGGADDWKSIAQAKLRARDSKIPSDWLLPNELRRSVEDGGPLDVLDVPAKSGILTQHELEITEADVVEICEKLREKQWKSEDVTRAFCKRAAIACQLVNCLTEIFFDAALERARELDAHLAAGNPPVGPLHGLPVSLKENFKIKGLDATVGYVGWANRPENEESAMTELLRELGAVLFVKTNVPASLMAPETYNNIYGYTPTPLNRKLSAGGSSGGEGALIAMRGSPLGVGTDIGGSVRIPAACNNLFGLRPSFGRFPTEGHRSAMPGQESIRNVNGPLSASLGGIELFARSIVGTESWVDKDPRLVPIPWRDVQLPGKLTLGVIRDDTIVAPNPPVKRGLQMAVDALQAQGHEIVELEFDPEHFMQGQMLLGRLYGADAGVHIREAFALSGEPFLPALEMYANAQGDGLTPKELWALHLERDAWCKKMAAWWNATASKTQSGQKVDGLIMPTTPYAAPKQHIWAGKGDIGYTNTWNLADYAAVTVPVTRADPSLDPADTSYSPRNDMDREAHSHYVAEDYIGGPVAIQVVGRRLEEEKVLAMAGKLVEALKKQGNELHKK